MSEQGKAAAEQAVFALKTLRCWYDVRLVTEEFDFAQQVLDTMRLNLDFWNPRILEAQYARGLARRGARTSSTAAAFRSFLQAGRGTPSREAAFPYDPAMLGLDTVSAPGDSVPLTVVVTIDSLPEEIWDSGADTVSGIWLRADKTPSDTTPRLLELARYRVKDSSDTRRVDRETWRIESNQTMALLTKRQFLLDKGDTVWSHSAAWQDEARLVDTVHTAFDSLGRAWTRCIQVDRIDSSSAWWRDPGMSIVLEYRDSLGEASGGVRRREVLKDTVAVLLGKGLFDTVSTEGYYRFGTIDSSQYVRFLRHEWYSEGKLESRTTDYAEHIDSEGDITIVSFEQVNRLSDRATVTYRRFWQSEPDEPCTLHVDYEAGAVEGSATVFGLVERAVYSYVLNGEGDPPEAVGMTRTESYSEASPVLTAQWEFVPRDPMPLQDLGARPPGTVAVTAQYRGGESTEHRRWALTDTGAFHRLSYRWVGESPTYDFDTLDLQVRIDPSAGKWMYESRKSAVPRWGVRKYADGRVILGDTLIAGDVRRITGTVDTAAAGRIKVRGHNAFDLSVRSDTLIEVLCRSGGTCPVDSAFSWTRGSSGEAFEALIPGRAGGPVMAYEIALSREGRLSGAFADTSKESLSPAGSALHVSPSYEGEATLTGVFRGLNPRVVENPDEVTATLRIHLWGTNDLGDGAHRFN